MSLPHFFYSFFIISLLSFQFVACQTEKEQGPITGGEGTSQPQTPPENDGDKLTYIEVPASNPDAVKYEDLHDPIADQGQFYFPEMTTAPTAYWNCVNAVKSPDRSNPHLSEREQGLQYHLLCQSIAGLVNRAVDEGKSDVAVWLDAPGRSYDMEKQHLGKEIGKQTGIELAVNEYKDSEGLKINVRDLFDGYVLTDLRNNQESNIVATVAAHVYNSIIVDVRDKQFFDEKGYKMTYDARYKTTQDAWNEFKDKCNNEALVVMHVQTGELREYAIKNNLFCINLNKEMGNPAAGQNAELFEEVLKWLKPGAPVIGWESGVGEEVFVDKVSITGHLMQAADWSYNHSLTSLNYKSRQSEILSKVVNPRDIDYTENGRYVSFFLSDGDNYQWVMNDSFEDKYLRLPTVDPTKMSFGLCSETLSQLSPDRFASIYNQQSENSTYLETFGGGYYYVDTFSSTGNRTENLKALAEKTAHHMRQHRLKVLHVMAQDWDSPAAQEAYRAFIEANDWLEGIIVIQFVPYNGGRGGKLWFKNKAGYDIPVISAEYTLWKDGVHPGQGSPVEIAARLNQVNKAPSYSAVCVHAWSEFDGNLSSNAAQKCVDHLSSDFQVVNIQELIWRIRMQERKEQTIQYLKTLK